MLYVHFNQKNILNSNIYRIFWQIDCINYLKTFFEAFLVILSYFVSKTVKFEGNGFSNFFKVSCK